MLGQGTTSLFNGKPVVILLQRALQEFGPLGSDGGIQKDAPSAVINNMDQNWAGSQQVLQQQQQGSENGNAQSSRGIASTAVLEVTSGDKVVYWSACWQTMLCVITLPLPAGLPHLHARLHSRFDF